MARSLLENGDDEEIVRSYQSVQENVNDGKGEVHEDVHGELENKKMSLTRDFQGLPTSLPSDTTHDANTKSADNPARQQQGEQTQSNKYDKSVRGKPRDDQQRTQIKDGFDNENRSPNPRSSVSRDRDSQSLPTPTTRAWGPDTRANVPQTTSAASSLWQVWDASSHPGAAQGQIRDLQENVSMLTDHSTPQSLQPSSAPLQVGAAPHFGEAQGRDYDTHGQGKFSPQAYPSSSQQYTTQPLQSQTRSRTREPQRNMPPTGGAYSSPQSQQYSSYTQQTSERSARGQGYGQGNMPQQPYTAQGSSQAEAKHRDGSITIGKLNGKGHF